MKKFAILVMLVGVAFLAYGGWQLWSTHHAQKVAMAQAEALLDEMPEIEKPEEISKATDDEPKINISALDYSHGEAMGVLMIPELNETLPIVEGTDSAALQKGVGHYVSTALPGQHKQILLSGHNNTVFSELGKLEIGDTLIVKMSYGVFKYTIGKTEIVNADDQTVIHPTAPKEVLTLSTCYPFNYIMPTPDRYIVYAYRS